MKLKALAAAAALMVAGSAQAVGPGFLGPLENVSIPIGASHAPGSFADLYSFTVSSVGVGLGATVSLSLDLPSTPPGFEFNVSFLGIGFLAGSSFPGPVLSADTDGSDGWAVAAILPSAGTYSFAVIGVADGSSGGAYGGVLQTLVPTPVPEPETYAMMLAGLGVLGFVTRRRRQ